MSFAFFDTVHRFQYLPFGELLFYGKRVKKVVRHIVRYVEKHKLLDGLVVFTIFVLLILLIASVTDRSWRTCWSCNSSSSDNNVYSTNPAFIFSGGVRVVGQAEQWGRDTGVDGVISNYPLLVSGGNITYSDSSDPKLQ